VRGRVRGEGQRETRWFTPAEAATLAAEGGLFALLLRLAAEDEQVHRLVGNSRGQPDLRDGSRFGRLVLGDVRG
jgi:hypothetical protein